MKKKASMNYLDLLAWIKAEGSKMVGASIQNIYYNGNFFG